MLPIMVNSLLIIDKKLSENLWDVLIFLQTISIKTQILRNANNSPYPCWSLNCNFLRIWQFCMEIFVWYLRKITVVKHRICSKRKSVGLISKWVDYIIISISQNKSANFKVNIWRAGLTPDINLYWPGSP